MGRDYSKPPQKEREKKRKDKERNTPRTCQKAKTTSSFTLQTHRKTIAASQGVTKIGQTQKPRQSNSLADSSPTSLSGCLELVLSNAVPPCPSPLPCPLSSPPGPRKTRPQLCQESSVYTYRYQRLQLPPRPHSPADGRKLNFSGRSAISHD